MVMQRAHITHNSCSPQRHTKLDKKKVLQYYTYFHDRKNITLAAVVIMPDELHRIQNFTKKTYCITRTHAGTLETQNLDIAARKCIQWSCNGPISPITLAVRKDIQNLTKKNVLQYYTYFHDRKNITLAAVVIMPDELHRIQNFTKKTYCITRTHAGILETQNLDIAARKCIQWSCNSMGPYHPNASDMRHSTPEHNPPNIFDYTETHDRNVSPLQKNKHWLQHTNAYNVLGSRCVRPRQHANAYNVFVESLLRAISNTVSEGISTALLPIALQRQSQNHTQFKVPGNGAGRKPTPPKRCRSSTPVLLCTTKYYSSITLYYKVLLQYYSVLQSTTPVLLCTTKYYSSTTLYYKVLLRHYKVYYSSTTPVLQSTTPVLFCTAKYLHT